jgi:ribonuclease HI
MKGPGARSGRFTFRALLVSARAWLSARRRMAAPVVSIYCDGSSHPERGRPGGWAYALIMEGEVKVTGTGAHPATTNNLMELQAALAGLREVLARGWHCDHLVELVSDSRFALEIASGSSLPSKDMPLCLELAAACREAGAKTRWVKGHSGDVWNEVVDALAHEAKESLVPAKARRRALRRRRPLIEAP